MRLTRKLVGTLLLGFLAVLLAAAWLGVRREAALLDTDVRRDHSLLGRVLARELAQVLVEHGVEAARLRVQGMVGPAEHVRTEWLSVEAPDRSPLLGSGDRAALRAGKEVIKRARGSGGESDTLFTFVPVPGHPQFALAVSESLHDEQAYLRLTVIHAAATTVVLLLVAAVLAALLGRHFVTRPIRLILDKINQVAAGDLTQDVRLHQRDELGTIAVALNEMSAAIARANDQLEEATSARIAAVEQLRHADRLTTVGKLASGVAHELGTPLSVIGGRAEMLLLGGSASEDARALAGIVREQTWRMTRIIRQLLDFARKHSTQKKAVDVARLADRVVALLTPMAEKAGVALNLSPSVDDVVAHADEFQLQQVLVNVMTNAIQATPAEGVVAIEVRRALATPPADLDATSARGVSLVVSVSDTGAGMTDEVAARAFEPFFTTKDVGEGTGLGLSVAHGIVREHGGWIAVDTAVGKGSTFSVYLPSGGPW